MYQLVNVYLDVWTEQILSPYTIYIKKGKKCVLFFLSVDPVLMCPIVKNCV